jgi:hypothetical protein
MLNTLPSGKVRLIILAEFALVQSQQPDWQVIYAKVH